MTGGIADVGSLADCLIGIHKGLATDGILDHYDRVRRDIYNRVINPISSENFTRLNRQDPEKALENDPFFKLCLKAEQDKEFSLNLQLVRCALEYVLFHANKLLRESKTCYNTILLNTTREAMLMGSSALVKVRDEHFLPKDQVEEVRLFTTAIQYLFPNSHASFLALITL